VTMDFVSFLCARFYASVVIETVLSDTTAIGAALC